MGNGDQLVRQKCVHPRECSHQALSGGGLQALHPGHSRTQFIQDPSQSAVSRVLCVSSDFL